ncbi:signal-transducing adaptor protein 2-like isoform X2 [Etheostoma cragini]|uniref:signal-transducing adaptor protein 2-like isoform X2 n=1 Tax=Etheostoma cragini TaxID=417921 RepID=UPI00155EF9A3|nr:signal-transducing adaptor protein 2-like isoform X2 [Etheostoma cragini]
MALRTARQRSQLPSCYYEGYLEKRSFKDKASRKLWTSLCGNTLFFFNDMRDTDYIEKVDLSGFISITDDGSQDCNLDAARFILQMKDINFKFTASSAETRELWKGYIQSVAELSVPSSLNLLPGQIHRLKEAVEKEKERKIDVSQPAAINHCAYISVQADMPACYHRVSRLEAELLLEKEAKRGNLLLRPGSNGTSFAVSTRQDLEGYTHPNSVFRHYRVTRRHEGGFAIDVDNPVPCTTLHDVVNYLVEKTDGVLIPLIIEEAYDKNITFIRTDRDNGETSVQWSPPDLLLPSLPAKPVAPRVPTPKPIPTEEKHLYQNEKQEEKDKETEDASAVPVAQEETKKHKRAVMPPTPVPRKLTISTSPPSSTTTTTTTTEAVCISKNTPDVRTRNSADPLEQTISELKLKLQQKARC